jgi:hypothetical protein
MTKDRQRRWLGSDGYPQVKLDDGSIVGEHRLVWEEAHGPIHPGYQIHHRNHDRADNRLSNLECVDTVTHKRLHVGHRRVGEVWHKTCTKCGIEQPDSDFPTKRYRDGIRMTRGNCRECERERQRAKKGYVGERNGGASSMFGKHYGPWKSAVSHKK